ncbi:hypothetical protein FDA94_26920 [Herbidospora galbida]|uniref:Secreted protein n=1 Tax=Herbidospora galbida TaxID=2575442 RepID=A0A4U3M911_9ACTN|nr:hypothetical protein [Herbidospora galbida]TKK85060.1 hypothetical protein FDA94_26920 [Herbidospora galbida]
MISRTLAAAAAGLALAALVPSPAAAAPGTKSVHLRNGLTIRVPATWKVYKVAKDYTRVVTGVCPTVGTRNFGYRDSGCRSFWVFGPAAIRVGHETFNPYDPSRPYSPATDVGPCVYDKKLWMSSFKTKPVVKGYRLVGAGHNAHYREWKGNCVYGPPNYDFAGTFTQREWYLPQSKILIVDQWKTPGLATILRKSTWN